MPFDPAGAQTTMPVIIRWSLPRLQHIVDVGMMNAVLYFAELYEYSMVMDKTKDPRQHGMLSSHPGSRIASVGNLAQKGIQTGPALSIGSVMLVTSWADNVAFAMRIAVG